MNVDKLKKDMERRDREIEELEATLKEKRHEREGMRIAYKLLGPVNALPTPTRQTELRNGSDMSKVYELLVKSAKPLHINEILSGIGREINRATRTSLSGSINSYVSKSQFFNRPAPGTFGLIGKNYDTDATDIRDLLGEE